MPCVSDWIRIRCGNKVCDKENPRHVGVVIAVINGSIVRIKWEETGWYSDLVLRDVEKIHGS
jgi:hypothetical protein